jgi:hypothetical protein
VKVSESLSIDPTQPVTARRLAADDLGVTPAQLALGWLLQLAPNVLLLAGPDLLVTYGEPGSRTRDVQ